MSRLAGRVTFPGEAESQSTSSNDRRPESQDARRGNGNNNRNRPPRTHRVEEEQHPESSNNTRAKPRGKGNVRYQGNYSDRFERQENQNPERFERRSERIQKTERTERPQRSERSENQAEYKKPARKPTAKVEDVVPSEELLELEDIIAQISDLNVRNDRSAAQIKRNILGSNDLIDTMDDNDWEKVCQSMLTTALDQGEPEFISDLIVALFKNEIFAAVMSDELMNASSKYIMEEDEKPVPALLSAILCAHWPRQYAKAFDNINPILYTVVCIVKGWIEVVNEDTENFHKEEKKPKYQTREERLEEEESEDAKQPEVEEEKEKIIEDPSIVNRCALALSDLCDTAQRQLWVSWMSVTDEIYQCMKPAITHNQNIDGSVKSRLLDTFIQMNQWTKTRQASVKHSQTQTVSTATSSE